MISTEKERVRIMEGTDIQFRTAALGGFSKKDVLDYIETDNQEHTTMLAQLQKELSECQRQLKIC